MLTQKLSLLKFISATLVVWVALASMPHFSKCEISDPAYHNLQEVNDRIFFLEDSLNNAGRNWLTVDSIGYSQHDRLPIYCVRITNDADNPALNKPAVVFIGQVHAEEVLGVELVLWMIPRIIANSRWRQSVDTYIVPTTNPEGLEIVYSLDHTYRKNKRDNIGDDRFRYFIGWGSDTSGVDINRNFPFFWSNGSTFLKRGDNEFYDYYRGPGPLSEPEAQCIDRLINRIRPLYSIVLHSSRTGKVAEQVIYPWHYGNKTKKCPDQDAYDALATEVAIRCKKYGQEDQVYERVRILNAQGDCEAYLYWKYGTFAMRVEIGAEGEAMQPDSAGMFSVLNNTVRGMEYLINAAARLENDGAPVNTSRLEIKVTDLSTGLPLEAKLVLPKLSMPLVPPRTTNPLSGWYRWPVWNGFSDTLTVSCFGYATQKVRASGGPTPSPVQNIRMVPFPRRTVSLRLTDGALPISTVIELEVHHPDSTWSEFIYEGGGSVNLPEGNYDLTFLGGWEFVPRTVNVQISSDTTLNVSLSHANILLNADFDLSDVVYTSDNLLSNINDHAGSDSTARWELNDEVFHSFPRSITDSRRGATFRNEDAWVAPYNIFDSKFDLSGAGTSYLSYWLNQALEPGFDSLWLEAANSTTGDPGTWNWQQIAPSHQELSKLENVPLRPWNANAISYQRYGTWTRFIVPLDNYCGPGNQNVHIRFRLKTDETLQEDGVFIDDIIIYSSGDAPPAVSSKTLIPTRFAMDNPFPNPFNSRVQVRLALPEAGRTTLALYDLTGRLALKVLDEDLLAGVMVASIDGQSLAAGMYILRATGPRMNGPEIRKLTLIK